MNKCNGILGTLLGHKFRARYDEWDELEMPPCKVENIKGSFKTHFGTERKIYKGDVCKRCGTVVNRQEETSDDPTP